MNTQRGLRPFLTFEGRLRPVDSLLMVWPLVTLEGQLLTLEGPIQAAHY